MLPLFAKSLTIRP